MTIQQLFDQEGIGLHDAYLEEFYVDYRVGTLRMNFDWWVPGDTDAEKENWRRGTLVLTGLAYCIMEAPDESDTRASGFNAPYVDDFVTRPEDVDRCKLPTIPESVFRHSLFVGDWNSFMHFAAESAEVEWTEAQPRSGRTG